MPLNNKSTTLLFSDTVFTKKDAATFTVQVANQTVKYQLNVPPFGNGENWVPVGGINLLPGFWNFSATDFTEYGAQVAQGIRFASLTATDPAIVSVN